MAKQVLQVTDFSAGLNAYSDAKDIQDNQFAQNWNAIVDKAGVIRVAGMAQDHISTDYHDSTNFQKGYGLFQFATDYSLTQLDGNFSSGITSGTLSSASGSTTVHSLAIQESTSTTDDYYNDMIIFIYGGTGIGESRKITDYDYTGGSIERKITTEAFASSLGNTSKYIIFRWKMDGTYWAGDVSGTPTAKKDVITNGTDAFYSAIPSLYEDDYYIYTKNNVADNTSEHLGSIQYPANSTTSQLTLKPGVQYYLTFNCAAKQKWTNSVSDGHENGSSSTNYGDKVPWVQLYSADVADASGCVRTISQPGSPPSDWTEEKTYLTLTQNTTSGVGRGAIFSITTDGSGVPTAYIREEKGYGYVASDTITLSPPDDTGTNFNVTVSAVNHVGLSLYNKRWLSLTDQAGYIARVDVNYVDNGDFADDYVDSWSTSGSNITFSSPIQDTGIIVNVGGGVSSSHTGTIAVDGEDATSSNILNRHVYNSSGRFVGICTAVGSTTSITFGGGTAISLSDDENLYTISSNGYDGVAGTLKMVSTGNFQNTTTTPDTYIYQELTLDTLTPHHLNFLYDASSGMKYSIYDVTNSKYIIPWTNLEITRSSNEPSSYRYVGADYSSKFSDGGLGYDMNYVKFTTPYKVNSTTTAVQIRLSCAIPSSEVKVHGVTVHKAHNDLVSMSYNQMAASPFSDTIQGFAKYTMSFIVPTGYSEVDTWNLVLNAGQYGYRTDANTLVATDTQEVYFDDIRLTSEEGDIVTLLVNNSVRYSNIHAYSQSSATWLTNFIHWNEPKAKPVFTYINGMLKISDANFATSNNNKLLFFQDRKLLNTNIHDGWVVRDFPIAAGPSMTVKQSFTSNINTFQYNAIPFLNEYFKNEFWGTTDTICYDGYPNTNPDSDGKDSDGYVVTPGGWPMDCFGTSVDDESLTTAQKIVTSGAGGNIKGKYNGLVMRHISHRGSSEVERSDECNTSNSSSVDNYVKGDVVGYNGVSDNYNDWNVDATNKYLFNTNDDWFSDNIEPGGTFYQKHGGQVTLSNRGFNSNETTTNHELKNFVRVNGEGTDDNIDRRGRWPVQFVIQGSDSLLSEFSLNENAPEETNSIATLRLSFSYECHWRIWNQWESNIPEGVRIKVGVPSGEHPNIKQALVDGEIISYAGQPRVFKNKLVGVLSDEVRDGWTVMQDYEGSPLLLDVDENITAFSAGSYGVNYGYPILKTVGIDITFDFIPGELKKDDVILISLYDEYLGSSADGFTEGLNIPLDWSQQDELWNFRGYAAGHSTNSDNNILMSGMDLRETHSDSSGSFPHCYLGTTFRINAVDLTLFNDADNVNVSTAIENSSSAQLELEFGEPENVESTGWGGRTFKISSTSVNVFGEESSLSESNTEIGIKNGNSNISIGHCPSVIVKLGDNQLKNNFVTKTKFYMRDSESEIYYLQFYIDHKNSKLYSTTSSKSVSGGYDRLSGVTTWNMDRENFKVFNEVSSYESETMVPQEDATIDANLIARYKTAVVANNRLYAGNILQNGKIYGDRMLKSPIGKYNLLPASSFIDVAINDGDEITALAYYQDKILQFKKRKIFVINISGDYEFLEDTFSNVGVNKQCQVVTTPHGIVWANRRGCHLYDGKSMTNLIDGVIPETADYTTITYNYWLASNTSYDGIPVVGYIDNRDTIIIKWEADNFTGTTIPDGVLYHFPTRSWSLLARSFSGDNAQPQTGAISNMITSTDGDLLYYRFKSGDDGSGSKATNLIKKWNNASYDNGGLKLFTFSTKDFTFGDVSIRKKIYKVYITYKTNSNSKIIVQTSINSANSFSDTFNDGKCKFQGTSTACYDTTTVPSNGLLSTSDIWKTAEMFFTTPSNFNKIYSLQLRLYSANTPSDFEINDISIVYRVKSVK